MVQRHQLAFVEDAGDGLHAQQNALDSGWLFDVDTDYSNSSKKPIRFLAQGRDASATLDRASRPCTRRSPSQTFYNDGDNEITGIHVSDGDPGKDGILGAKDPSRSAAATRGVPSIRNSTVTTSPTS